VQVAGELRALGCVPVAGTALRACAELLPVGAEGAVGTPCYRDEDCRSGMCVAWTDTSPGYCSDACCSDDFCGDTSRLSCRPVPVESNWSLQCALE